MPPVQVNRACSRLVWANRSRAKHATITASVAMRMLRVVSIRVMVAGGGENEGDIWEEHVTPYITGHAHTQLAVGTPHFHRP